MSLKQVIMAILNMLFRLGVSCLVVIAVYRAAMYAYHFGYMVFNDAAKEISPGRDITISIEMDDSVMKIGETLESRGLVEDAKIFYVQERLSEYHGELQPGVYTLNTSMKPSEIIASLAKTDENLEEDSDDMTTGAAQNNGGTDMSGETASSGEGETGGAAPDMTESTDGENNTDLIE